jgi:hypothetical protein
MADDETEQPRPKRSTRDEKRNADVEALMLVPAFRRLAYCILMDAGVLRGGYGANPALLPWSEGRRSLGLDFLNTLQSRVPDALVQILNEELRTQKETNIGRRNYDRRDELRPGDPDGRQRGDDYAYLDYGGEQSELRGPAG